MLSRAVIIEQIAAERNRQFNLPGIEFDMRNTPSEWISIAAHYLFEEVRRGPIVPSREGFDDSLIKAAAVIVAALEHADTMTKLGTLI